MGFNISGWVIIGYLLSWPFVRLWSFNPFIRIKDNKLNKKLRDLIEEMECYINYINKGPVVIETYKMKRATAREMCHDLSYLYSDWKDQRVQCLTNKILDKDVMVRTGGRSAGGCRYFKKTSIDLIDTIAEELYRDADYNLKKRDDSEWKRIRNWRETMIDPIYEKYGIQENKQFYCIRRALIILSHSKDNHRSIQAKKELSQAFFDIETAMESFISEVEGAYAVKVVYESLM